MRSQTNSRLELFPNCCTLVYRAIALLLRSLFHCLGSSSVTNQPSTLLSLSPCLIKVDPIFVRMVLSSLTLRLVGSLGVKVRVDGDRSANTWGMVWCKGTSMKDILFFCQFLGYLLTLVPSCPILNYIP